ncbi:ABC transporter substrate-binding protein [Vineibacter terrae]|uniref:ABC transporter substrate-binding protein n=1 Tax=Vineibacter terrae TaxID=2586908 RepID=UPI0039C8E973
MAGATPALAQKKYDPGASDSEIKVGNTGPYSGPASAFGTVGTAMSAYFKMINDKGGVRGRKINFISLDDGYSRPPPVSPSTSTTTPRRCRMCSSPAAFTNALARSASHGRSGGCHRISSRARSMAATCSRTCPPRLRGRAFAYDLAVIPSAPFDRLRRGISCPRCHPERSEGSPTNGAPCALPQEIPRWRSG